MHNWGGYCACQTMGVPQPQAEGAITSPVVHWRTFLILFHQLYTEKQVYISYFLRITASRAVVHVFVWLSHLQLKLSFNFHRLLLTC